MYCELRHVGGTTYECAHDGCGRVLKIELGKPTEKRFRQLPCRGTATLSSQPSESAAAIAEAMPIPTLEKRGVGSTMKLMLLSIGIRAEGCACPETQEKMDREGPAWCREHLDELCDEVYANAKKWGLAKNVGKLAAAAMKARAAGIKIDPTHPIKSFVLEAICRTEAQQCEA